ncbi:TPA: replication endonuclease, partial [Escherichia coli]|nr:replication endonuclease [Escherichia coli]
DDIDAILAAADVGCFATYITRQGGVLIPRNTYLVRTAYETAEEANDYGEFPQRIYGVRAPSLGERYTICTHPDTWKLVRRKPENEDRTDEGFDVECGFSAPWTRGNNCPPDQNLTINDPPERQPDGRREQRLTLPEGDLGEWLRSLTPTERKQLTRQLKNPPPDTETVKNGGISAPAGGVRVSVALTAEPHITAQITRELDALGVQLHESAVVSVRHGARVRLADGRTAYWNDSTRRIDITPAPNTEAPQ